MEKLLCLKWECWTAGIPVLNLFKSAFLNWWVTELFWSGRSIMGCFPCFKKGILKYMCLCMLLYIIVCPYDDYDSMKVFCVVALFFCFCGVNFSHNFMIRQKIVEPKSPPVENRWFKWFWKQQISHRINLIPCLCLEKTLFRSGLKRETSMCVS